MRFFAIPPSSEWPYRTIGMAIGRYSIEVDRSWRFEVVKDNSRTIVMIAPWY